MAVPKGVIGNWDLTKCTPAQIEEDTKNLIADLTKIADEVGSVPLDEADYGKIAKVNKLHCKYG
jgi:hypothetical protein